MTHVSSSIRYKENESRLLVGYRTEEGAEHARAALAEKGLGRTGDVAVHGGRYYFGVDVSQGVKARDLLRAFGHEEGSAGYEANIAAMTKTAYTANIKDALRGLELVTVAPGTVPAGDKIANIAVRMHAPAAGASL